MGSRDAPTAHRRHRFLTTARQQRSRRTNTWPRQRQWPAGICTRAAVSPCAGGRQPLGYRQDVGVINEDERGNAVYVHEAGKSPPEVAARLVKAITAAARSARDATPVLASGQSEDRATAGPCAGLVAAGSISTAANVPVLGAPPAPTDDADAPFKKRPASSLAKSFDAPSCGSAALGPNCSFVYGDAGAGTSAASLRRIAGQVAEPGVSPCASDVAATADGAVAAACDAVAAVGLAVCGDPDDAPLTIVSDGGGFHATETERAATGCGDEAVDCGEL